MRSPHIPLGFWGILEGVNMPRPLGILLTVLLVLLILGLLPVWPYTTGWGWGWYPSGGFGLLLIIVILLLVLGESPRRV